MSKDISHYRARLMARLKELDHRLHDIEDALDDPKPKDWEESATEREGDEVLEALGQTGQAEIARIRAALGRIRTGDYGVCARCGEEIAEARLDAVPEAPLCAACAQAGT